MGLRHTCTCPCKANLAPFVNLQLPGAKIIDVLHLDNSLISYMYALILSPFLISYIRAKAHSHEGVLLWDRVSTWLANTQGFLELQFILKSTTPFPGIVVCPGLYPLERVPENCERIAMCKEQGMRTLTLSWPQATI